MSVFTWGISVLCAVVVVLLAAQNATPVSLILEPFNGPVTVLLSIALLVAFALGFVLAWVLCLVRCACRGRTPSSIPSL